ncbi:MAG TPA: hypothetical protein VHQ01_08275, partial [Pyrinomonadaceae bacterium]|nr:hypothetical protein [Pyrinomonadaceae bacterium]
PLFLQSTNISYRTQSFALMAFFALLASTGRRYARLSVGGTLLGLALFNVLVMFAALSSGNFTAILTIVGSSLLLMAVGWPLLTSKSIRAFEITREAVST